MSTQPIPDLSTISIPLRRPATAPATPAAGAAAQPAPAAQPTMADDGKSVSFDTTAGEAEAIDMDRALDLALAVADGQLTGTEAKRLGMDRNSLRTLLEATADGKIDGKELAKLAPKKVAQPTPTGGTGTATGATTPAPVNQTPTAQTPAQPGPAAKGETYTIEPGDTLSKIAKAYTKDPQKFKELLALNPHIKNPDKIFPGQKLTLPASWSQAAPATGTGTGATTGTPATTPANPATGTPATGQAPGTPAGVSSRISGEAEVKAMQEATKYLSANFDKVAGADGMVSKDDIQKNMPDGPGKAGLLKHFDDLKFLSIDPGADAWTNLTKQDVHEIGRTLDWRATEGGPLDWQFHAEGHQHLHKNDVAFKAADRDGNGRLEGDEIPADMRGKPAHLGGSSLSRTDWAEHRELVEFGKMMDDSGERVAAWKRAQGMPTTPQPNSGTINGTPMPVGNGAQPAAQPPATTAQPATQTPAATAKPAVMPPVDEFTKDDEIAFARLDYSGDGVINNDGGSPYRNNARFDTNKDGEITRQEFLAGRAAERKGKKPEDIRQANQDEDDFARLDRSGDGFINNDGGTPYRNNAHYDTNKDNAISREEFLAGRAADRKNGRPGLTAEQSTIANTADSDFDELDLSGDGVINNDGGAPYRNNARFDTNKDGEITRQEYVQGRVKEGR
jgi:LysM repeat protein